MGLRIVHCADVHLETIFNERGGAVRRSALGEAFVRIVDEALARRADVLTIGGDLYEAARTGPQTVRFLFEQFARFGNPIFIAPGNHDPFTVTSPFARADLPTNVRVFDEAAWRAYPLADDVTLYGFGHTPAEPGRPFAGATFDRGGLGIALFHGSDEDRCPPQKRATAPFTIREIAASGAALALCGHYHGGYTVRDHGTIIAYPGSPEPIRFGESAQHGALEITVANGAIDVVPIATATTRLIDARCDLDGAGNDLAIFERVEGALATYGPRDFVRLELHGGVQPGTRVAPDAIAERFASALGSLAIRDHTTAHDYESIAREPTVRGHVVRDLLAAGPAGRDALRYALAAFDGSEIAP